MGSFLFIGTTGVGKTETARALASVLFDTEDALVRFDMSEFSDRHSTSKLIGTPPGYIGFEQRGRLTEEIRVSPFSVLLFDEVEKAHQDVLHILLQVLSDGRLSDNHGRMVDFKNTIIIMTSNISFNLYPQLSSLSEKDGSVDRISLIKNFIPVFTPEMINRINEVVVFNSLTRVGVLDIISLELKKLTQRILENKKFVMEFDSKVPEIIFSRSYNEVFGARSVQQFIRREIESVIAREIIRGVLKEGFIYFLY